jgi:hypothetical protein
MGNRIQPENNRTFKTGAGNWTGPLVWHGDILDFHQGYITVDIPGGGSPVSISLAYPYIKPAPGEFNGFGGAHLTALIPPDGYLEFTWVITDGVYTAWTLIEFSGSPFWFGLGGAYSVPADWDIPNTILTISIRDVGGMAGQIAFDDFDLTPYTKAAQYLPIMGVG